MSRGLPDRRRSLLPGPIPIPRRCVAAAVAESAGLQLREPVPFRGHSAHPSRDLGGSEARRNGHSRRTDKGTNTYSPRTR